MINNVRPMEVHNLQYIADWLDAEAHKAQKQLDKAVHEFCKGIQKTLPANGVEAVVVIYDPELENPNVVVRGIVSCPKGEYWLRISGYDCLVHLTTVVSIKEIKE